MQQFRACFSAEVILKAKIDEYETFEGGRFKNKKAKNDEYEMFEELGFVRIMKTKSRIQVKKKSKIKLVPLVNRQER